MKPTTALIALIVAAAGFTAQAAPGAPMPPLKGEVLETQNVEGYTYLRLKTAQGEAWAAVPTTTVKKGAQVTIGNPVVMQNFESKTLKKTFDKIVFGQVVEPGAPSPPRMAPRRPRLRQRRRPGRSIKVAKATGADAKTVAEVVTGKATLTGKTVLVRGQVVKVNSGILGKTWLHLQDGSGSAVERHQRHPRDHEGRRRRRRRRAGQGHRAHRRDRGSGLRLRGADRRRGGAQVARAQPRGASRRSTAHRHRRRTGENPRGLSNRDPHDSVK